MILIAAIGIDLILSAIFAVLADLRSALALLASGVLVGVLLWLLIPVRYEVYADGIRLVFRHSLTWRIAFSTVAEVKPAQTWKAYGYVGFRFATDPGRIVEIVRIRPNLLRRPNLVISPENRDEFVAAANAALEGWRRARPQ